MTNSVQSRVTWQKSTASGAGNCVEVAFVDGSVLVRHSRNPSGPALSFSSSEWAAFLAGTRNSEFDLPEVPAFGDPPALLQKDVLHSEAS